MSVELNNIAQILEEIGTLKNVSKPARLFAKTIREAVLSHTITSTGIFAYETDGRGSQLIMDDANVPSLVSFPYLGFLPRDDPTYRKTKDAMFSRVNGYYAEGDGFKGIG